MEKFKIVFMGTPEFAVPALRKLYAAFQIQAVITAPDKPAGRGKQIQTSAVKKAAIALDLEVMQPVNLKDETFLTSLRSKNADLFVVLAFRMLPEKVWSMPRLGTINLHASLLPAYRGAAPINRAIMAGENQTGLTTFYIEKDIDAGKIIASQTLDIGANETAGELHDRMMYQGSELLLDTVNSIKNDSAQAISQQGIAEMPLAPKIFKEDCKINWSMKSRVLHNHIRGLSPYPAAWTIASGADFRNNVFKVFRSKISSHSSTDPPGTVHIANKSQMFVTTTDGSLEILELQVSGKKKMEVADFLRGLQNHDSFHFHD